MVVFYPIDTKFKQSSFVVKGLACLVMQFISSNSLLFYFLQKYSNSPYKYFVFAFLRLYKRNCHYKDNYLFCSFYSINDSCLNSYHTFSSCNEIIKQSQVLQEIRKSVVDPESNFSLILQLILITVSNILCWFSTNSVYVTAMFLNSYPTNLIIFTVITCLPLNSIIIPSVSVSFSVKKMWKKKKKEKRPN